jgi:hypothetical protein
VGGGKWRGVVAGKEEGGTSATAGGGEVLRGARRARGGAGPGYGPTGPGRLSSKGAPLSSKMFSSSSSSKVTGPIHLAVRSGPKWFVYGGLRTANPTRTASVRLGGWVRPVGRPIFWPASELWPIFSHFAYSLEIKNRL